MTSSLSGTEKDRLIQRLTRDLTVARAEAEIHLNEVKRHRFIISEITEAAEGGYFVRQNTAGDYMYVADELAEALGYGDVGMAYSYSRFLDNIHPEDLRSAIALAEARQPTPDRHASSDPAPATAPNTDREEGPTSTYPDTSIATASIAPLRGVDVKDLPASTPIPPNIFTTGPGAHLQFRYRNQEGDYRWFRASTKRYQPEDGPEQLIGMIQDIHEMKLLEAQRREVHEEMKAFMYSVAHDLRAPVRHIASFAEAIREEPDAPADDRELYLSYVERSADKLGKMIDGLLKLSRNQNYSPSIKPVDVGTLLDELISKTRQTEQQAPELIIERDPMPVIHTDADLIEQVLQNLLSNAVKYSSHQERATVNVRYYLQEAQHIISFSDNGIGFDPAYADKLFKLFSRLYQDADIPGTGVGLASVHRIMRNLNGTIEADGKLGVGATFTLRLPVRVGATSAF